LVAVVAGLMACGSVEPEAESALPPPGSAGSVVTVDLALANIVPANYQIEKLRGGFTFVEGPVWVRKNGPFLLFSDIPENGIYKWMPDGTITDFLRPVFEGQYEEGRLVGASGLTLDPEGRVVIAEQGGRRISRLESDGSRRMLVEQFEGRRLNSPNDLVYKSDGWLYFTDPPFGLLQQDDDPSKELAYNGIFRLSPEGKLELLDRSQTRPNGIAFSPDEKTLYVSNSDPNQKLWMAYEVGDDGAIGRGRVFLDVTSETLSGLPDGLKTDKLGNIYATGPGGVWIFSPEGRHLGTIRPEEVPANVAWGDDGKTLYMTARTGIYRIRLNTEGPLLQAARRANSSPPNETYPTVR